MTFDPEQLELLPKKERKEIRRKQRLDAIKELRRFRKIQKIIFWAVLMIILFGSLYILMALVGYAQAVSLNLANLNRTLKEFLHLTEELAKKNCLLYT